VAGKTDSQQTWLWEAGKIVLTGLVASAATVAVGFFTFFNDARELDLKMMDVSLSILSGEKGGVDDDTNSEYLPGRMFALDALEKSSGVKIEKKEEWAKSGKLSLGDVSSLGDAHSPANLDLTTIKFITRGKVIEVYATSTVSMMFDVVQTLAPDPQIDCFDNTIYKGGRTSRSLREEFDVWVKGNCPNGVLTPRPAA
jgi:hypothetical protein